MIINLVILPLGTSSICSLLIQFQSASLTAAIFSLLQKYLFIYLNFCPDLFSVSCGLVQCLQPHITQSQHGVGVVLCGRLLQNTFKLLLTRSPFLFGQMEVPYKGPGIWVILQQRLKSNDLVKNLVWQEHHCISIQTTASEKEPD